MKIKRRESDPDELKLNMTAMIDIVFQLLVFFIMTFKVTAMEADFSIRMPAGAAAPDFNNFDSPEVIEVKLLADGNRNISGIDVTADGGGSGVSFTEEDMYSRLTDFVETTINKESDPSTAEEIEVEFDIDGPLKYQYTVRGIEAVSGKVIGDRKVKKLIEKIKFRFNGDQ